MICILFATDNLIYLRCYGQFNLFTENARGNNLIKQFPQLNSVQITEEQTYGIKLITNIYKAEIKSAK